MDPKNKKMVWWGVGAALVLVIVIIVISQMGKETDQQVVQEQTDQSSPEGGTVPPETATTTPEPSGTGTTGSGKLGYTDALKKYGTNRIQFDSACQTTPNNVTFKKGTQVMFDNRAPVARTINFNGSKISIPALDYKIVSMTAAQYPAKILVDCDKSQNVATVLIQN